MRRIFFLFAVLAVLIIVSGYFVLPELYRPIHAIVSLILIVLVFIGFQDVMQRRQAIRRNFPIIGRFRYLLEKIRPEIYQYFIESNSDGAPFSREMRSIVYQRAKKTMDTIPFGTQMDVYQTGYEWLNHSVVANHVDPKALRVMVGGKDCKQPYNASLMNISAMSYGALSSNAIMALNGGAKDGNFAHNTGEGSISSFHLKHGGDLIWQIGTGYFGCRDLAGHFSEENFVAKATLENVKMIELKLSQGAKPGHGGILPKGKVTKEIAEIRGVPMGEDVNSPPSHSAFNTPLEMMYFIKKLRDLSGGKPVGFKLSLGKRREFIAICKAMIESNITPDFITVDGGEGGTGAAPLEFANYMGGPGVETLIFVHNVLKGFGLRKEVKVIVSGKIVTAFGLIKRLALGADMVNSARAMMMALGCIQALRCNSNDCPAGVATQDPHLVVGLDVKDKRRRVKNFHEETLATVAEMVGAMGMKSISELKPWHIIRRVGHGEIKHYGEIFDYLNDGDLLKTDLPKDYARAYRAATAKSFHHINDL